MLTAFSELKKHGIDPILKEINSKQYRIYISGEINVTKFYQWIYYD